MTLDIKVNYSSYLCSTFLLSSISFTTFILQNSSKVDRGRYKSVCSLGLAFSYRYANHKSYADPKLIYGGGARKRTWINLGCWKCLYLIWMTVTQVYSYAKLHEAVSLNISHLIYCMLYPNDKILKVLLIKRLFPFQLT